MALTQRIAQISVVLAAFICIVVSQATLCAMAQACTMAHSVAKRDLFTNIQSSVGGQPTGTAPANGFDFTAMGGGMPGAFPSPAGSGFNMPAPPRPNAMQNMLPLMMWGRGSDLAQSMLLMQMMGGGAGGMGFNPMLIYGLMHLS